MTGRRKSFHYPSDIHSVLVNAQITRFEIENESDERKRHELKRDRELAQDQLIKIYRDASKRDEVDRLPWEVRYFCESLKARNGGRLPVPKGGRPRDEHRALLMAIKVREAIEVIRANGGRRGTIDLAIQQVAAEFGVSYRRVREVYYNREPAFLRELRLSLALRGRDPSGIRLTMRKDAKRSH